MAATMEGDDDTIGIGRLDLLETEADRAVELDDDMPTTQSSVDTTVKTATPVFMFDSQSPELRGCD